MKTTSVKLRRKRKVGVEKFVKGKLDIWWTLFIFRLPLPSPHLIKRSEAETLKKDREEEPTILFYSVIDSSRFSFLCVPSNLRFSLFSFFAADSNCFRSERFV
uniref:Uncharacterized protein n=1 Tax=Brassica oleracea TaxID=3712 RepID=A0A3P6GDX7_BRAOL|nr:unnamed protein product [Brassica oleracea]